MGQLIRDFLGECPVSCQTRDDRRSNVEKVKESFQVMGKRFRGLPEQVHEAPRVKESQIAIPVLLIKSVRGISSVLPPVTYGQLCEVHPPPGISPPDRIII